MKNVKFEKVGFKKIGMWCETEGNRVWMKFVGNEKQSPDALKTFVKETYKEGDEFQINVTQDDEGTFNVFSVGTSVSAKEKLTETPKKRPICESSAKEKLKAMSEQKPAPAGEIKKTVVSINNILSPEKKTNPRVVPYTGKKPSYGTNPSIEKQCAMKCATEIVVALIEKQILDGEKSILIAMDVFFDKAITRIQNG